MLCLALRAENMLKIAAPRCRIRTLAELMHGCPIQNRLNAGAKTASGFWSLAPNRLKEFGQHWRVNAGHVQVTNG